MKLFVCGAGPLTCPLCIPVVAEMVWYCRRKRKDPEKICPSATSSLTYLKWTALAANPGLRREKETSGYRAVSRSTKTFKFVDFRAENREQELLNTKQWYLNCPAACSGTKAYRLFHLRQEISPVFTFIYVLHFKPSLIRRKVTLWFRGWQSTNRTACAVHLNVSNIYNCYGHARVLQLSEECIVVSLVTPLRRENMTGT